MKKICFLITLSCLLLGTKILISQTIWTGPTITFTKANSANWTLAANQDQITSNVWITRANNQGIFNIVTEPTYTDFFSPADTEWAIGTTADIGSLNFQNWEDTSDSEPPTLVNQNMVVHLITDDIYIDIKFTSWQSGGAGGGFSYERSTDQNLNTFNFNSNNEIELFPNPSNDFIKLKGLTQSNSYTIYNLLGGKIFSGTIANNEPIDIKNLSYGFYFIKLESGTTLNFQKK